jgi:hypothetical protein
MPKTTVCFFVKNLEVEPLQKQYGTGIRLCFGNLLQTQDPDQDTLTCLSELYKMLKIVLPFAPAPAVRWGRGGRSVPAPGRSAYAGSRSPRTAGCLAGGGLSRGLHRLGLSI